jgi:hypothetical protein
MWALAQERQRDLLREGELRRAARAARSMASESAQPAPMPADTGESHAGSTVGELGEAQPRARERSAKARAQGASVRRVNGRRATVSAAQGPRANEGPCG